MQSDIILELLESTNETLTAAIVVIAASMLLYNLTRNLQNRIARTSAVMLACVTITYIGEVFLALNPGPGTYIALLRLQWVGIAYMPAALLHMSDALLATTGLPSRGRRRRVVRILYLISSAFLIAAAFTDILVYPVSAPGLNNLQPGYLFWLFLFYFIVVTGIAFINVQRARLRCLTRSTQRRMGYLQIAMLTPPLGIFPYSLVLGIADPFSLDSLMLINLSNVIVILMLLFLAYPLSFFGSNIPDRVVKTELLRFMLRGPATGLLVLAVTIFVTPATRILSFPAGSFTPFALVAVVLLWQWIVALSLPYLEKRLIYFDENDDQIAKLQDLSDHLLTRGDLLQLVEAILESVCDYIQVNTAFILFWEDDRPEMLKMIGTFTLPNEELIAEAEMLRNLSVGAAESSELHISLWRGYWLIPVLTRRATSHKVIGLLGIEARSTTIDLTLDEIHKLDAFTRRMSRTLDDMLLQSEIFIALEGLLPQYNTTRTRAAELEYKTGRSPLTTNGSPDREQIIEQVRAALRHYWGGAGLTNSRLQELKVVQKALAEDSDANPLKALRGVLQTCIEKQKPDSPRKMTSPEWTIYNILHLRFIERIKVRDVAIRLALSEPDLYRKQRVAIELVADSLLEMERELTEHPESSLI